VKRGKVNLLKRKKEGKKRRTVILMTIREEKVKSDLGTRNRPFEDEGGGEF